MPAYKPPLEGRRGRLRLDFNERTVGAPECARQALAALSGEDIAAYPEYASYVQQLADYLGVAADQVLPTNATDEAIQTVMLTYVEPGERVLVAVPTFAMIEVYARIAGGIPLEVPYRSDDLSFPAEPYLEMLRSRADIAVAVLVDPNNPTGTDVPAEVVRRACDLRPDVVVFVDEAYGAFTGRTLVPWIERYANLVVSQTFSKAHGLAGLRIGHLVACRETVGHLARVRSPYSVNVAAMAAASAIMAAGRKNEPGRYVGEALAGRDVLAEGLKRRGVLVRSIGANFVLIDAGSDHARVVAGLRERGLLVRDRSADPGLLGCVRITAGQPAQVQALLAALDEVL